MTIRLTINGDFDKVYRSWKPVLQRIARWQGIVYIYRGCYATVATVCLTDKEVR